MKPQTNHTTRVMLPVFALLLLLSGVSTGLTQDFSIRWSCVGSGGGAVAGGTFNLCGTVGQPALGLSHSVNRSLAGGFWASDAHLAPSAPNLRITRVGPNVILWWPAWANNYTLESADDLTTSAVWTAVSQPPTFLGDEYATPIPATKAKQFFRLVRQ